MSEKEPTDEVGLLYEIYQWLLLNVDHIVAASNYTISAFMFGLGSLVLYYIFRAKFSGQTDILYMMWGIVFEAYGWCIHRFYWGQWRTARLYKDEEAQQWFVDHAYLALIPSVMVIIGLVLIIGPAISWVIQTKKRWTVYAVTFGFAVSIWWFAYWALEEGFRREREEKLLKKKVQIETDIRKGVKILNPSGEPTFLNPQKKPLGPALVSPDNSALK